uniref:Uncharacterized protein n=1 Tax=Trichogramma kaykai TaxID=54128 RepID=A0ABD2WJJ6_9HYME
MVAKNWRCLNRLKNLRKKGYDALAERCVVRSVKTGTLKELTPHKKLTVEKHFEHYLNYYNDDPFIISYHMGKINNYANRAIGGSRKKLKAMKEYPEIDMEDHTKKDTALLRANKIHVMEQPLYGDASFAVSSFESRLEDVWRERGGSQSALGTQYRHCYVIQSGSAVQPVQCVGIYVCLFGC